jgi:hypothetical protein
MFDGPPTDGEQPGTETRAVPAGVPWLLFAGNGSEYLGAA